MYHAVGILCDDIRQEASGSVSLMGVFPDNVLINQLPSAIPRVGVYVRVLTSVKSEARPITAFVRFPNGDEQEIGAFEEEFVRNTQQDTERQGGLVAGFILITLSVNFPAQQGRTYIIARVGDEEFISGGMNLQLSPSSTASQPPA